MTIVGLRKELLKALFSLLPGFVVFVGVVLPVVMVALWTSWECCYEVDEEDEEECRCAHLGY